MDAAESTNESTKATNTPLTVFMSYAPKDVALVQHLEQHLSVLTEQGILSTWHSGQLMAGTERTAVVNHYLEAADIILLLISPDFVALQSGSGKDLKRALERHEAGQAQVVPLLLRPVDWQGASFAHLPLLPANGRAITRWKNRDEAFADVVAGLRQMIASFSGRENSASATPAQRTPSSRSSRKKTNPTASASHITNQAVVQGQTVGENNTITQTFIGEQHHYYGLAASAVPVPLGAPVAPSAPVERVWNVPYSRNGLFTGREELLSQLATSLHTGQPTALSQPAKDVQLQAISGLGGIGKTQVALEYAYRHRGEYQAVLWVQAESRETLTSSYLTLATLLDLPEKEAQESSQVLAAMKQWLQQTPGYLLILDNADELKVVRDFLPSLCAGHVVLTTRAQAMGRFARRLEVETWSSEQGAVFLLHRAGLLGADTSLEQATERDQKSARELCEELGGLPLALDQAGAYIEKTGCSLASYEQLYQQRRATLLAERRSDLVEDHPLPVAATWKLSFERVEQQNPAAADLLRVCAFLAADGIPESILTQGAAHLGPYLAPVAQDAYQLNGAIEALRAYSLVKREQGGETAEGTLSVHRLVQAVLTDGMGDEERRVWAERAVLAVNEVFPSVEHETWGQCERMLPHALMGVTSIEQYGFKREETAHLLNQTGYYLSERARYKEAEPLYQRALAIREEKLGAMHPSTALSLNNLAALYYAQGKYAQAEPLYERALAIYEEQLGAMHPLTALSLNNLAGLYKTQGKYAEAEPLYQRALAIHEEQLGAMHPDTAGSLNNLAALYDDQGKYSEAEPLYKRALAIREEQLGAMHPSTAESLNNLAELYRAQGNYAKAEPLYERALAIHEEQLGARHPSTATSVNNLALLYHEQGKYAEAEPLYQRALAIDEEQLGARHPETARSLNNLAGLYESQGKYSEAEPLYERAVAINEEQLGARHPETARSLNNLAGLYYAQGKYMEAEPLYERALAIQEQTLGVQHPETAGSQWWLGTLAERQGKGQEARGWYEQALDTYEQSLGVEHPNTQALRSAYTALLRTLEKT